VSVGYARAVMRKLLAVGAVAAGMLFVACGGGAGSGGGPTTPATDGTAASGGGPVAIAPMKLVLDKDGRTGIEVRADGSIVTGDGALIATFDGRKLVGTSSGKGIVIGDDGKMQPLSGDAGDDATLQFDVVGDIVSSDGHKIAVAADGSILLVQAGKGTATVPAHIVGMTPATHRMASLLVFVALMAHRHVAEGPDAAPAPAPTP
jgi:hypothetical protein